MNSRTLFPSLATSALFILLAFTAHAQKSRSSREKKAAEPAKQDTIELTTRDITKIPTFNAGYATVFGIGLDMSIKQVKTLVESKKDFLELEKDPFDSRRYYLYDISQDTDRIALAYLKWPRYDTALIEITLFPPIARYMQGLSCSIMSSDCLNPESELYNNFLGKPAGEVVTLEVPSVGIKTVKYYYSRPRMIIEKQTVGDKDTYTMVLYRL